MVREPSELPIDQIRSEYLKERNRPCLIKASTGSGKSTRIPIWLLEEKIPFILVKDGYTEKSEKEIKHDELISDFLGFEKIIKRYL